MALLSHKKGFSQDFESAIAHIDLENMSTEDCFYLDSCLQVYNHQLSDKQKIKYYYNLQLAYEAQDNNNLALYCNDSLIQIYKRENNFQKLAEAYRNKSILHDFLGNYPDALKASQKSLEIFEKLGDVAGQANSYNDIGVLHYYVGNQQLARTYFDKSLDLFEQLKDTAGIGMYYNNMANTLYETEELTTALDMYNKALEVDLMLHNKSGQTISLSNIGETYIAMEEYDKAEKSLLQALNLAEQTDDKWDMTNPLRGLGELYRKTGELHKAVHVLEKNVKICNEIDAYAEQSQNYNLLYELYKKDGNYEKSLLYLEKHKALNDSIFSKKKEQKISEMEMKYQIQDKAQQLELLTQQKQIESLEHEKEMKSQRNKQFALIAGLLLMLILIGFAIRGFLLKKKANEQLVERNQIIEQQHQKLQGAYQQIEEKNEEILDSIRYAKRIQSAILPPKSKVKELLGNNFILYKPKDVVAGDFYWLEKKNNTILFAAADCTGHGVPGAMVSVVCNNGLNRSVRESGLTDPGKILDQSRALVLEEFGKSEEKVNDGMDIALCALTTENNDPKQLKLKYAGAHNPLWIVRKTDRADTLIQCADEGARIESAKGNTLVEFKADKQPIGKFEMSKPFTTREIPLEKGDTIYIFSDGFADQFGGEKGKKMKTGNFKKLLLDIQHLAIDEQYNFLEQSFEEWKGDFEQIDDVCVIGVRV